MIDGTLVAVGLLTTMVASLACGFVLGFVTRAQADEP